MSQELTAAQILQAGLQVLETGGWWKGEYGSWADPTQPHCAEGALRCAVTQLLVNNGVVGIVSNSGFRAITTETACEIQEATRLLHDALDGVLGNPEPPQGWTQGDIPRLNDMPSTTHEDVMLAFKQAIGAAEEGSQ